MSLLFRNQPANPDQNASAEESETTPEVVAESPLSEPASAPAEHVLADVVSPDAPAAAAVRPASDASKIGRLRHVSASDAFGAAPDALRAWVAGNLDAAGEATGQSWTDMTRDRSATGATWPLVAASATGLGVFDAEAGDSSAECLGRMLTSMVECGATTMVWVAGDPRPEHAAMIAWLNASGAPVQCYLLRMEAIRIDDSIPAPLLTTVVRPSRGTDDTLAEAAAPAPAATAEPAASAVASTESFSEFRAALTNTPADPPADPFVDSPVDSSPDASTASDESAASLLADTGRRSTDWGRLARGLRSDSEG